MARNLAHVCDRLSERAAAEAPLQEEVLEPLAEAEDGARRAGAQRIRAGERFDVILCDLMMPEVSGYRTALRDTLRRVG
ncbi:MAG TPA: hypothetical protein VF912_18920 [Anaeromyxobacter sp.]